jgi:hypothetical protein
MIMTGQGEVLFELTRIGHVVRVTAFDTLTLREVTIQGPATGEEACRPQSGAGWSRRQVRSSGLPLHAR